MTGFFKKTDQVFTKRADRMFAGLSEGFGRVFNFMANNAAILTGSLALGGACAAFLLFPPAGLAAGALTVAGGAALGAVASGGLMMGALAASGGAEFLRRNVLPYATTVAVAVTILPVYIPYKVAEKGLKNAFGKAGSRRSHDAGGPATAQRRRPPPGPSGG